ncbi:hypothetical protein [Chromobacterium violaceum]|uniref:hypothetical protein n=1 Tax=Chromobacterium violaceum TaxID=536 RepID=UPI000E14EEBB|nr:hypothetical protein [Chromobacterium violaceum]SUX35866.1 Uncharacterised protein [Chromobacterium violaceum]
MFDDYDFKNIKRRVSVRFSQKRDEPIYPWEIAGFLSKLNTSYYKLELLNSICSAISNGVSPENIFILNSSLPLYQRHAEMNLLNENHAYYLFHRIGLIIPLIPNRHAYNLHLVSQAFSIINSFLHQKHVGPLPIRTIEGVYEVLNESGLESAEEHMISLAMERARKSLEKAQERGKRKEIITKEDILIALSKYSRKKKSLLNDLEIISRINENDYEYIIQGKDKESKRLSGIVQAFYTNFDSIMRPLVCARIGNGKIRVFGRSLVNKKEDFGLELKEAKRNSPLGIDIAGGVALAQFLLNAIQSQQSHKMDIEKKALEIEEVKMRIESQNLINQSHKVDLERKLTDLEIAREDLRSKKRIGEYLEQAVSNSDVNAIQNINTSFNQYRLAKLYTTEQINATKILDEKGLEIDKSSIRIIDNHV